MIIFQHPEVVLQGLRTYRKVECFYPRVGIVQSVLGRIAAKVYQVEMLGYAPDAGIVFVQSAQGYFVQLAVYTW